MCYMVIQSSNLYCNILWYTTCYCISYCCNIHIKHKMPMHVLVVLSISKYHNTTRAMYDKSCISECPNFCKECTVNKDGVTTECMLKKCYPKYGRKSTDLKCHGTYIVLYKWCFWLSVLLSGIK